MHFEVLGGFSESVGVSYRGELAWTEIMVKWDLIEILAKDSLGSGIGSL